jgi:hypothetical protein
MQTQADPRPAPARLQRPAAVDRGLTGARIEGAQHAPDPHREALKIGRASVYRETPPTPP